MVDPRRALALSALVVAPLLAGCDDKPKPTAASASANTSDAPPKKSAAPAPPPPPKSEVRKSVGLLSDERIVKDRLEAY